MENQNSEKKEKKSRRGILIFIIFLELAACGVLSWLLFREKERSRLESRDKIIYIDKSNLFQHELAELKQQFERLQTDDEELNRQLKEKIELVQQLEIKAEKHKSDSYIISKLKKEAETLRSIMKSFVRTIDSLNTLNINITAEKEKVTQDLSSEKNRSEKLVKEKEELEDVVFVGSILRAFNINARAVRFKSDGTKEIETNKAKKAEKIKIEFALSENRIAKSGDRLIYARVMTPDGKEMARAYNEANMFRFKGLNGFFAGRQPINYQNGEMMVNMYCEKKAELVPGKYLIELYSDEALIGETSLTLE